jgi:hypothetical protein
MASGKLITFVPGKLEPIVTPWKKDKRDGEEGDEEEPPLKLLQEMVDGWIGSILVTYRGKSRTGYFNEEGELKQMSYNQRASEMCGTTIVGPFVISIPD